MKRLLIIASLVFANVGVADVASLNWLAGHWCGTNRGILNEEVWLEPQAGTLLGMHRDTRNGKFLGFEFFRIVENGTELVYWTQPEGRPAVAFRAKLVVANRVDFLNPAHDFPKRITYRRIDADTLWARVDDGADSGKNMEWTWRRNCPR